MKSLAAVMKFPLLTLLLAPGSLALSGCNEHAKHDEGAHKVIVTTPKIMDVTITQPYVCQIRSQRHINVKAMDSGYITEVNVKEGQSVKKGDSLFRIISVIYKAKLDTELAEVQLAQLELVNTQRLFKDKVVSEREVLLFEAKLRRAEAKMKQAQAEYDFTNVQAQFDGIVDRLNEREGSLVKENDVLTTLSDNSTMWVYFNVPEKNYLLYKKDTSKDRDERKIELILADGAKFDHPGKLGAIEADFNNENGNLAFRADFPNPERLLRNGMTGNVLIQQPLHNVLVIPQRAMFEILAKQYVYVVDAKNIVHQREIEIEHELQDAFVIRKGLKAGDRIIFEGTRQVRDGEAVEYEFHEPDQILANQNMHAE